MKIARIPICILLLLLSCSPLQGQEAVGSETSQLIEQAKTLSSKNRLAEAEVVLTKAAQLSPNDNVFITLLAEVKSQLGETEEAVALFQQVVVAQPKSPRAHLNLGIALADTANTQHALSEIETSISLEPKNALAHLNRARLLSDLHRPVEARREFRRAKQLDPNSSDNEYFWGIFEKENQRPRAAASHFASLVALQPGNVRAIILLAQMQSLLGNQKESIDSWRKVLLMEPRSEEATYALSQALRTTEPAESSRFAEQFDQIHAEKQKNEHIRELGNQAYAAMQHQDWQAAVVILKNAIDICAVCSLQADLHQRLGLAECHGGDLGKGEEELRMALSLNPNDRETLKALEWVEDQKRREQ